MRFVFLLVGLAAGCGTGKAPAPPPECDQACRDNIALRAVRETMRFDYNFALQSKPVGKQDAMAPCLPTGSVHIVGTGDSNAMLGTTTVDLTYKFTSCVMNLPLMGTPERNYALTIDGAVRENGTLAMGGPTTSVFFEGSLVLTGTVYDPAVDYDQPSCEVHAHQDGNTVSGIMCGRMAAFTGF